MTRSNPYDWARVASLGFNTEYIERNLPDSYKKGLTLEEQNIAQREVQRTMKKASEGKVSSKELYKDWESDKRFRKRNESIPKSKATAAFEDKFAEMKKKKPSIKALENKSKKSGIPLSILKKVYNRGMAAWRSGHRPGVAPQQWALARVNSFITGVGKAREADADLWKNLKRKKK